MGTRPKTETALPRLMAKRRSIRKYQTRAVPRGSLMRVLKSAYYAPSGADRSGYELVVVSDPELKRQIRTQCEMADAEWHRQAAPWLKVWLKKKGITPEKPFLEDAPHLICVFGDNKAPYWLGSTWLAVAYMLLAAERERLATLTYTPGKSKFLQKLLNLKSNFVPVTILPLGYAAEHVPAKRIKPGTRVYIDRVGAQRALKLG